MSRKFKFKDIEKFKKLCDALQGFEKAFEKCCNQYFNNSHNRIVVSSLEDPYWSISISKKDIEVVENLKPYVWYPSEKFDGNPNNYILVEDYMNDVDEMYIYNDGVEIKDLDHDTFRFMYLDHKNKYD